MSETIEMLTEDDNGHAIEGPKFPADLGVAQYLDPDDEALADARLAYRHKFFRYSREGTPMPETLVHYLVPDYMLIDGRPNRRALNLVAEREGWGPFTAGGSLGPSKR